MRYQTSTELAFELLMSLPSSMRTVSSKAPNPIRALKKLKIKSSEVISLIARLTKVNAPAINEYTKNLTQGRPRIDKLITYAIPKPTSNPIAFTAKINIPNYTISTHVDSVKSDIAKYANCIGLSKL